MPVQGHLLDITVSGCRNLQNTEWFSRQDPYVILEYASIKYRTKTDTDGGRNPDFHEEYMLPLIEGLNEINVTVLNSNTFTKDDFLGSGKILVQRALIEGYHESTWPLLTRKGRRAGEVKVILRCTNPGAHTASFTQQAPPVHAAPSMYPPPSHMNYTQSEYAAYPPSQPSGYGGYPPAYVPPPQPSGHGGYYVPPPQPSGHGGYPPAYVPPPQPSGHGGYSVPYPPEAYPPYPPQGYGAH